MSLPFPATRSPVLRAILFQALIVAGAVAQRSNETAGGGGKTSSPLTSRFLWLSDFHYDPFYGQDGATTYSSDECSSSDAPSRGMHGCDSPLGLVQGALLAAADAVPDPSFVLITGDFARHGIERTDDAMGVLSDVNRKIAGLLAGTFPDASIVPSLGNNDAKSDYYLDVEEVNNTQLAVAADAFRGIFESSTEEDTFRAGGYFARDVGDGVTVLSLNTVIYSRYHKPSEQSSIPDPLGQFAWMDARLGEARDAGRRVMLTGHMPPTIGSYRKTQFWYDHYLRQYFDLSEEYSDIVSAQLFGHLHSDEFRVFSHQGENASAPLLLTGSVTPVFGNNPTFRIVDFDSKKGDILDYEVHSLNLEVDSTSSWQKLYSFREAYGVKGISVRSLRQILSSFGTSEKLFSTFLKYQRAGVQQKPCDSSCQSEWVCALQATNHAEYANCLPLLRMRIPQSNRLLLAAVAAAAFAVVLMGVMCYRRRRRKAHYEDVDTYNIDASDDISL